jgi:hypothetical protein
MEDGNRSVLAGMIVGAYALGGSAGLRWRGFSCRLISDEEDHTAADYDDRQQCEFHHLFRTDRPRPTLVYVLLLVVNLVHLHQMQQLIRRVRSASRGEQTLGALKPFMRRRRFKPGRIVFHGNDVANSLYDLVSGSFSHR